MLNPESVTRLLEHLPADTPAPKPQRVPIRVSCTLQTAVTVLVFWTLFVAGFTYSGATDKAKAAQATTTAPTALAASQSPAGK